MTRRHLDVHLLDPVSLATEIPLGSFTFEVQTPTFARRGGPKSVTLKVRSKNPHRLEEFLQHLRAGVEIWDEFGKPFWWGYVSQATVKIGGVARTVSLENYANRVRVVWQLGDAQQMTDWAEETTGISLYGYKELQVSSDCGTQDAAESYRDMLLAERSVIEVAVETGASVDEDYAELQCDGYYSLLDWRYYERTNLYYGRDTRAKGETGGSFYIEGPTPDWVDGLATAFDVQGDEPYYLESVQVTIDQHNGNVGTGLTVEVHAVVGQDIPVLGGPTKLAGTTRDNINPFTWNDFWVRKNDGTRLLITPGETYWVLFAVTGIGYPDRLWWLRCAALTGPVGEVAHEYPIYWRNRFTGAYSASDQQAPLFVNGVLGNETRIAEAIASHGQVFPAANILDVSGLYTYVKVEGDVTLQKIVEEVLELGTVNHRELLGTVTANRHFEVSEQADGNAGNAAALLGYDGRLYNRFGAPWSQGNPCGQWCTFEGTAPAVTASPIIRSDAFLIDEASYDPETDAWTPTARGAADPADIFSILRK